MLSRKPLSGSEMEEEARLVFERFGRNPMCMLAELSVRKMSKAWVVAHGRPTLWS